MKDELILSDRESCSLICLHARFEFRVDIDDDLFLCQKGINGLCHLFCFVIILMGYFVAQFA